MRVQTRPFGISDADFVNQQREHDHHKPSGRRSVAIIATAGICVVSLFQPRYVLTMQCDLSSTSPTEHVLPQRLVHGDALTVLDSIEAGSCRLVVTSPPYNIGKEYEREQRLTLDEYLAWLKPIIEKLCEKVADNGHICWQTGNFVNDGEVFPLDLHFYSMFKEAGFKLRNRIIWHFNFGLHAQSRFSGRYETILWFSKGDKYVFNLDPVRVPQRYPGKRHAPRKGAKAGTPSGNPLGKNPSDFWTFEAEEAFKLNPTRLSP